MTSTTAKLNEYNHAEEPARRLLEAATCVVGGDGIILFRATIALRRWEGGGGDDTAIPDL